MKDFFCWQVNVKSRLPKKTVHCLLKRTRASLTYPSVSISIFSDLQVLLDGIWTCYCYMIFVNRRKAIFIITKKIMTLHKTNHLYTFGVYLFLIFFCMNFTNKCTVLGSTIQFKLKETSEISFSSDTSGNLFLISNDITNGKPCGKYVLSVM